LKNEAIFFDLNMHKNFKLRIFVRLSDPIHTCVGIEKKLKIINICRYQQISAVAQAKRCEGAPLNPQR